MRDQRTRDRAGMPHPSPDEVQGYVDDALDRARHAAVAAHVASCAACGAEVARLRRVTAALALASAPPADLFDRIQARRRAGEHVILPVGDDAPPLPSEQERRVDAALSLASSPPDDLFERIAARRAAGERVLLPLPGAATSDASSDATFDVTREERRRGVVTPARAANRWQRTWRWAAGPGVAAAVLLLVARALQSPLPRVAADGTPAPSVATTATPAATPSATPPVSAPAAPALPQFASAEPVRGTDRLRSVRVVGDSASAPVVTPADSATPAAAVPHRPVTERESADEIVFVIAVDGSELDSARLEAVDRAARLAREDTTQQVLVRYSVRSAALVARIEERLILGGVAEERIRRRRVERVQAGLPARVDAVEVVIPRARDEQR